MKYIKNILSVIFLFTCFSIGAQVPLTDAEDGLILFYDFSEKEELPVIRDLSSAGNDGLLKGEGAVLSEGALILPGGGANSRAAYVELPKGMFDSRNTLTISIWLKNETGSGNYAAMFFGTTESLPFQYWLLNPANPNGHFKSVITNSLNTGAPYNTEYGISPSVAGQGITGPTTDSGWHLYTTIITSTTLTAYYDDTLIGTVNVNREVSDFGSELVSYIGKSSYADIFYQGSVKRLKVYTKALSAEAIKEEYCTTMIEDDLNTILSGNIVLNDVELLSTGKNGTSIRWASSDIAYLSDKGKVIRPVSNDKDVMLTATCTLKEFTTIRTFPVVIFGENSESNADYYFEQLDLGITYVTEDIQLPQSDSDNFTISWVSNNNNLINENGKVTRPAVGSGDQEVVLTARLESQGKVEEKSFTVIVAEADYGYLLSYILTGNTERTDALHLACSEDGSNYTVLNNGKAILYPLKGTKKLRSPGIFRKPDGSFGVIAADNNNSSSVIVFRSEDLIDYSDERLLELNSNGIRVSYPECKYDNLLQCYVITWKGSDNKWYQSLTKDFLKVISTTQLAGYTQTTLSGNFPENATEVNRIPITYQEYERLTRKYGRITNTGIAPLEAITIRKGEELILPDRVVAEYSDGSSKSLGIIWNQEAISNLDLTKPGSYTISGTVQQPEYTSPFIRQRADPWVTKGDDGYYYFTASYPMFRENDPEGYDRVILRRATTIEGLRDSEEITIWDVNNCSSCYRYVWAPEIHQINGTWFVFFTTSVDQSVWSIRPRVIVCNQGEKDPFNPDCWEDVGHLMEPTAGDNTSFTGFSLDMTHFENKGVYYVVWAQTIGHSSLAIASVDKDEPWKTTSGYTLLTSPEYAWEWENDWVNEGPAVIKNDGKIYMAFSASSVNHTYCVGLLYADEDADLLDINSWTKVRYPLLSTDDLPEDQNGPGHNSFTIDEYGNPVIVYHARNPEETIDGGLYDPGRHAFVKSVNFAFDGTPILNMTAEQELAPEHKEVSINIVVTK